MTFRELAILMPNSKVLFSYNIESRVIFEKKLYCNVDAYTWFDHRRNEIYDMLLII